MWGDVAIWVGLSVVWSVPAYLFHFRPAMRGDFAHAESCPCADCKATIR